MKLTDEECIEIARRKEAGATYNQIAPDYHISTFTVGSAIRRAETLLYHAPLNGKVERARMLERMGEDSCGGCGQQGLCQLVEQSDRRFPPHMWLCGICQKSGVWR